MRQGLAMGVVGMSVSGISFAVLMVWALLQLRHGLSSLGRVVAFSSAFLMLIQCVFWSLFVVSCRVDLPASYGSQDLLLICIFWVDKVGLSGALSLLLLVLYEYVIVVHPSEIAKNVVKVCFFVTVLALAIVLLVGVILRYVSGQVAVSSFMILGGLFVAHLVSSCLLLGYIVKLLSSEDWHSKSWKNSLVLVCLLTLSNMLRLGLGSAVYLHSFEVVTANVTVPVVFGGLDIVYQDEAMFFAFNVIVLLLPYVVQSFSFVYILSGSQTSIPENLEVPLLETETTQRQYSAYDSFV